MKKTDLDSIINFAASQEMRSRQYETFAAMEPSSNMNLDTFREAARAAESEYVSVRTILGSFAELACPTNYLEIGTRRGHSLCLVVASASEPLDVYSFDLWIEGYAGEANPGPSLIEAELQRLEFDGNITFIDGDSRSTVPAFFANAANPQSFDLVVVDGDHSDEGAELDLENVADHVSSGGVLVFDDIAHPAHPGLLAVWRRVMERHPEYESRESLEHEYGWAVAQRTPR
jgi:predicted O-methyltransferase YrrM